ncbi:cytoskeleton-associated protein 2-like [Patagioenas fasciata monilis]|uniref:Cytoskeleton-associated protein 2-like n=1 Tax=Patagioenas fasciata monilis TaxID=372326 RepID=A0A1V4KHF8_PATFA|nr:cytoskeleton-associated protein 2-like [Patagioenas fasciata monilis]
MERAGAAEGQRRWLQQNRAARETLKCFSAKPFLKDQTNRLNQPSELVSKLEQVDRNKKDVPKNAEKGAQGGAKSTEHAGHAARHKSLGPTQSAAAVPKQPMWGAAAGPRGRDGRVPKTPRAANRRKELEAWVAAKGRVYKRPPMVMLQKTAVKLPCRNVKEKKKQEELEKQEEPEQLSLEKINNILIERLKRVEEPIQELKEFPSDVSRAGYRTSEGENTEQPIPWEPKTPCQSKRQHVEVTPCMAGGSWTLPSSIKLLVKSASRAKELQEGQEVKLVTPVRRSQRIEWGCSCYPEMLQEHDTVVSSLSEILEAEEETRFFYRKNKALPEVPELEDLSSAARPCRMKSGPGHGATCDPRFLPSTGL